ncbi:uncharacterized protein BKA78DRAFT_101738 [Phyllosticta capitalensis]|uniref:uncharacterized protein n=1 Tax=Phyllosticta capitalensis TaxID=121624 RepID=UPI00312E2129
MVWTLLPSLLLRFCMAPACGRNVEFLLPFPQHYPFLISEFSFFHVCWLITPLHACMRRAAASSGIIDSFFFSHFFFCMDGRNGTKAG